MINIDEWHVVKQIKVLTWIAATHNHQAGGFGGRLDARQLLCRLDDVRAATYSGDLVDALGIQGQGVEGLALDAGGIDFNRLQGFSQRLQMDLQRLIGTVQLDALFFVSNARNAKRGSLLSGLEERHWPQ